MISALTQLRISNQQALEACLDEVDQRLFSPEFEESIEGVPATGENIQFLMDMRKDEKEECYKNVIATT